MLAEFYLTPHALADDDGRNGAEVVEELERTLENRLNGVDESCLEEIDELTSRDDGK